jgi:hypothetical protein
MAIDIDAVEEATVLPKASFTATDIGPGIVLPESALPG